VDWEKGVVERAEVEKRIGGKFLSRGYHQQFAAKVVKSIV
jgi:hypothetical protein